jgi:hypothetical protein
MKFSVRLFLWNMLMAVTVSHADPAWTPALEKNGVAVWTRAAPGFSVHEFKAVTRVRSTLTGLVALILDTGNAPAWVFRTRRIDVLHRDDKAGEFRIRVITEFPWPLHDREVVVEGKIRQEADGRVVITSRSADSSQEAPEPGCVRMPYFSGTWIFRPLGKGEVEVTMQGLADPGGIIPGGIVNLIIHETPYQTLRGLRRVIGNPQYQAVAMARIREP